MRYYHRNEKERANFARREDEISLERNREDKGFHVNKKLTTMQYGGKIGSQSQGGFELEQPSQQETIYTQDLNAEMSMSQSIGEYREKERNRNKLFEMPMLSTQQYLSPSFAAGNGQKDNSQNSSTVSNAFLNRYVKPTNDTIQSSVATADIQSHNLPDSSHFQQKLQSLRSALDHVKTNVGKLQQKTIASPKNTSQSPFGRSKDLNTSAMIAKTIDVWEQDQRERSFTIDYQNTLGSSLQDRDYRGYSLPMNKSFDFNAQKPPNHRSSMNLLNRGPLDTKGQMQRSFSRIDQIKNAQNIPPQHSHTSTSDLSCQQETRTQSINNRSSALLLRLKQVPSNEESNERQPINQSIVVDDHQFKRDFKNIQLAESLENTQGQPLAQNEAQNATIKYPLNQSIVNGTTIIHFSDSHGLTTKSVSPSNVTHREPFKPLQITNSYSSKSFPEQVNILESHKTMLEGQVKELQRQVEEQTRSEQQLARDLGHTQMRNSELEKEILFLRTKNHELTQTLKVIESERNQLADQNHQQVLQEQRKEAYIEGLEAQISMLQQDLERFRHNNQQSSSDYLKMREFEKQLQTTQEDLWKLNQVIEDKDKIIQDLEFRLTEQFNRSIKHQQSFKDMTLKTPGFGKNDTQSKRKNHRNKSADIAALSSTDTMNHTYNNHAQQNLRNTQTSFYEGQNTQALKQSQSSFNLSGVQELLSIIGVSSIQELIQTFRKIQKDRKFCSKIIKLVKDVEGKRPDTLRDCWKWIRGLLQDFVNLKRLLADQQRILKKIEVFFSNQNNNTSSYASSYNGGNSQVYSVRDQVDFVSGYNSRDLQMPPALKSGTIDGRSSYSQLMNTNQGLQDIYNISNLSNLEYAIDTKLKSFRQ